MLILLEFYVYFTKILLQVARLIFTKLESSSLYSMKFFTFELI